MSRREITLAFSAPDLSGDSHLALLLRRLREHLGGRLRAFGLASSLTASEGGELLADTAGLSAIGMFDNLRVVPRYLALGRKLAGEIIRRSPRGVILVDSRVFNLGLARRLRRGGYQGKIVYYIAPVRWESLVGDDRGGSARFMAVRDYCDLALLAYPLSLATYRELNIPHRFIGHPLAEAMEEEGKWREELSGAGLSAEGYLLILPGSRRREIELVGGALFAGAALALELLGGRFPLATVLAHPTFEDELFRVIERAGLGGEVRVLDRSLFYPAVSHARAVAATSGTALHAALIALRPCLAAYRVPGWQAWAARHLLGFSLPHYSFINLMAGREVIRELIQEKLSPQAVADELIRLSTDREYRRRLVEELSAVRQRVVRERPVTRAARLIAELLEPDATS